MPSSGAGVATPTVHLSRTAYDALCTHAREGAAADPPREVCGVLGGREGRDGAPPRVDTVRPVPNVASDPTTRYELDPAAAMRAIDAVAVEGSHLGFYHSHPRGPPEPSDVDRAEARWPGFLSCLVVPPETVRIYRWTGEAFERLRVRLVDGDRTAA